MNCDEHRARLISGCSDAQMQSHTDQCESCALTLARMRRCEDRMAEAIQAVYNPALVNRVLMISQRQRTPSKRLFRWTIALAASLAVVALGARLYAEPTDAAGWGELILAHVDDNPHEFYAAAPQPTAQQSAILREVGFAPSDLGDLRAIRSDRCKMKRTSAVHTLVEMEDTQGVVFLLPKNVGEAEISAPDRFAMLTTRNDRTVAVVARNRRDAHLILATLDRM
jgi:hypothetical protein